jgi:hypothetical protein
MKRVLSVKDILSHEEIPTCSSGGLLLSFIVMYS